MTTYTGPDRTYSAGVPSQGSDSFAVTPEGLISGEYPAQFVQDIPSAASQTLAAYTVVGYDQNKRMVKATYDVVDAVAATGTLTFSGTGTANDTITIGSTVYTLKASVGTTANEVLIGASAAATAANLVAAITGGAGAGTTYGSATTPHASVTARTDSSAVVGLVAKTPGTAGNAIATTETGTGTSFAAATLGGGKDQIGARPIGIAMYPVTAGAGVYPVVRVLRSACLNHKFAGLVWDSSFDTDAKKIAAFEGAPAPTQIICRTLAQYTPVLP